MAPPTTSLSPLSLGPTKIVVADHKIFTTTRHVKITRRKRRWSVSASSNKDSYDGKLVDENMIVLRLRIRKIQMEKTKMMNGGESVDGDKALFDLFHSAFGFLQHVSLCASVDKLFTTSRHVKITPRRRRFSVCASSNKDSYDGKLVDENMNVLRLRIREMQMEKMKMMMNKGGYWRMMEWERRYKQQNYASDD
ncbi:hypothetical protein K1719_029675 [Acacia pycnantha]|nr:hypothetical protein K1719_029675 [Acacia pycnantha]